MTRIVGAHKQSIWQDPLVARLHHQRPMVNEYSTFTTVTVHTVMLPCLFGLFARTLISYR
jgi:hypothetical protein